MINLGAIKFSRYIGIDYSGAETPTSSLKGLRVYLADHDNHPEELQPPPSPRKYWTRRGIAEWLVETLSEDVPTIVGIDHGFSFPLRYFEYHHLPPDWYEFLDDFHKHWPTDEDNTYVDFVRDGLRGNGADRTGNPCWRRLTEERARSAKSVFHFDVQGRWPSLPIQVFPGCDSFAGISATASISGPLTDGKSLSGNRQLWKYALRSGAGVSPKKTAHPISMTLIQSHTGSAKPTMMAFFQNT
jgi:hypothetical protein